jgi:tetratricopeptide (TPR) repeat protein
MKNRAIIVIITIFVFVGVWYFATTNTNKTKSDETSSNAVESMSKSRTDTLPSKENVSSDFPATIAHLKDEVKKNPKDASLHFKLAGFLHDAHNAAEAASYYESGLKLDSKNVPARVDYSLCLYELKKPKEAFEQNQLAYKVDPKNAQVLYNLGACYANFGKRDSAVYFWHNLMTIHPESELASQAKKNMRILVGGKP